jgi:single-strand DNA-binding protein
MNLNKVYLIGRVASEVELKTTTSGNNVCTFSLATNRTWKNKDGEKQEESQFHRIVLWQKLAEIAGQYLTKGGLVLIEGRLMTRDYEDKSGTKRYVTEIIGESMQLGPKSAGTTISKEAGKEQEFKKAPVTKKESFEDMEEIDVKDIPF